MRPGPLRILGVGYALTALGVALRWANDESDLFELLWQEFDLEEAFALRIESTVLALVALAGVALLWASAALGCGSRRPAGRTTAACYSAATMTIGVWATLWTISATILDPWHPEWIPAAHATRWLAPISIAFLLSRSDQVRDRAARIASIAVAATFVAHGAEAFLARPEFIDLVHALHRRLGTDGWSDAEVGSVLVGIAVVDWFVAAIVLAAPTLRRTPSVEVLALGWMAFWGLVTALARIVQTGENGISEALLRTSHFTTPLALAWIARQQGPRASVSVPD